MIFRPLVFLSILLFPLLATGCLESAAPPVFPVSFLVPQLRIGDSATYSVHSIRLENADPREKEFNVSFEIGGRVTYRDAFFNANAGIQVFVHTANRSFQADGYQIVNETTGLVDVAFGEFLPDVFSAWFAPPVRDVGGWWGFGSSAWAGASFTKDAVHERWCPTATGATKVVYRAHEATTADRFLVAPDVQGEFEGGRTGGCGGKFVVSEDAPWVLSGEHQYRRDG